MSMLRNLATSAMNAYKAQSDPKKSSQVTPYPNDLLEDQQAQDREDSPYDARQSYYYSSQDDEQQQLRAPQASAPIYFGQNDGNRGNDDHMNIFSQPRSSVIGGLRARRAERRNNGNNNNNGNGCRRERRGTLSGRQRIIGGRSSGNGGGILRNR